MGGAFRLTPPGLNRNSQSCPHRGHDAPALSAPGSGASGSGITSPQLQKWVPVDGDSICAWVPRSLRENPRNGLTGRQFFHSQRIFRAQKTPGRPGSGSQVVSVPNSGRSSVLMIPLHA